ncbi:hypothetical protein NFJ02_07g134280 [Pycnococcus provasolii]
MEPPVQSASPPRPRPSGKRTLRPQGGLNQDEHNMQAKTSHAQTKTSNAVGSALSSVRQSLRSLSARALPAAAEKRAQHQQQVSSSSSSSAAAAAAAAKQPSEQGGGTTARRRNTSLLDSMHNLLEEARYDEISRARSELFVLAYGARWLLRRTVRLLTSEAMSTVESEVNRWVQGGGAEKVMRASLVLPSDMGQVARAAAAAGPPPSLPYGDETHEKRHQELASRLDAISERLRRIELASSPSTAAAATAGSGSSTPLRTSSRANQQQQTPQQKEWRRSREMTKETSPNSLSLSASRVGVPRN